MKNLKLGTFVNDLLRQGLTVCYLDEDRERAKIVAQDARLTARALYDSEEAFLDLFWYSAGMAIAHYDVAVVVNPPYYGCLQEADPKWDGWQLIGHTTIEISMPSERPQDEIA